MVKEIHKNMAQSRADNEAFHDVKALLPIESAEELQKFENFCSREENTALLVRNTSDFFHEHYNICVY